MNSKHLLIATLLGVGASFGASAAPVLLGSVDHLYGSNAGRQAESIMSVYNPGGNCDTLNPTSVTVRATRSSTCNRFGDIFDFSTVDFASLDRFEVTLSFSGARDLFEAWNPRGAPNYVVGAQDFGSTLNSSGPQTFTFSSTTPQFASIVAAEQFVLSFAQTGFAGASSNFTLNSARLDVFGTAAASVPEPSSVGLVGLSLAALGAVARRSRKAGAA